MLESDSFDYSDAYIVAKGTIIIKGENNRDKKIDLKNILQNALCIIYMSKINKIFIDNAEDLDADILMHNLIEDSKNYRKTTSSLWIYYRNEPNVSPDYNTDPMTNYASFEYQGSIIGKTPNNNNNDYDSDDNEKRCWDCSVFKIFKQVLENFRYAID